MDASERLTDMIYEDDSDVSSFTIDNDTDSLYSLDDVEILSQGKELTSVSSLSIPRCQKEVVDLTADKPAFHDGEYVTDECYEVLREEWNRSVQKPVLPPEANEQTIQRKYLPEACVKGIIYKPGQSVQLHDNTYLRICEVLEDDRKNISFKGRRMIKNKHHAGTYIPEWSNELVWVANEHSEIALDIVKCFVNICFTSYCHPEQGPPRNRRPGTMYCRLKEIIETENTVSVEYLSAEEADHGHQVESVVLRQVWRGQADRFGSHQHSPVIVLDDIEQARDEAVHRATRRYTFGDGFCGAGGVSCGAQKAGLHIKWSFDQSHHATATYRLNFPTAECETSDIFSFLTNDDDFLRVDVTHGSPPCQTFSPAHTVESANDDANSACIFSSGNLIRRAKPRVHTMEETSGLFERHKDIFYRVIRDFIEIGYSVRWTVLNCMEYGVPQSRKRLIIIASGPGETLPPFPKPTHGLPGSGLRELTTINQVISNIPDGAPDHDVEGARGRGAHNWRAPFDPNQQARTITCGGGEHNYHPSGQRGFTNREFASLQTFPLTFRFGPREVRKQIGNAVPPRLARAIYGEIIKSLQQTDEKELRRRV